MSQNKECVLALLKAIETGESAPIAIINPEHYTQHNLGAADGLVGFGTLLSQLPEGSARVNTIRTIEDGNFVATHTDYDFFGPKIGFDIFRFEDGQIVEHWDNMQEKPSGPNPSDHTMIDGATEVIDSCKTAENKALIAAFVDDILVNGRLEKLADYFNGDNYIQHNPQIADGLTGLGAALAALAEQGIAMVYTQVHKIIGEGNFVLVASEGTFGETPVAYYDLFRVQDDKIAEHWDVIQSIPPRDEWKNENGKF